MTERYGQVRVIKLINKMERLRKAIRSEGTPRIQEAWDEVEPSIDYFLQPRPVADEN